MAEGLRRQGKAGETGKGCKGSRPGPYRLVMEIPYRMKCGGYHTDGRFPFATSTRRDHSSIGQLLRSGENCREQSTADPNAAATYVSAELAPLGSISVLETAT